MRIVSFIKLTHEKAVRLPCLDIVLSQQVLGEHYTCATWHRTRAYVVEGGEEVKATVSKRFAHLTQQ